MSLFLEYCVEIDNFEEKDNVTEIRKRLKAGGQKPLDIGLKLQSEFL